MDSANGLAAKQEAVADFAGNRDFSEVGKIQQKILLAYEQDFSKHAPFEVVPRIRMVWNAVPAQLAKENRKFIYGLLKHGARAREFELAIAWLIDCGLLHKVCRASKPALPLKAYEDFSAFKLFLVDIGLLSAMSSLDVKILLDGNRIFEEFKGSITEQYALQQMIADESLKNISYWSAEQSNGEVDFLVQCKGSIIPVEVKSSENLQAKSLRLFAQKNNPPLAVRASMSNFRREEWFTNLPLYAISELSNLA